MSLSTDGRFIVSGSAGGSIKVFSTETKEQLHHFQDAHSGMTESPVYLPYG